MRISLIIFSLFFTGSVLAAEAPQAENFTPLFAETCMQHFYSEANVRDRLMSANATPLSQADAAFFLDEFPGKAWGLSIANIKYVIAFRDDKICTVFAQSAPVKAVHQNFETMLNDAPKPLIAKKISNPKYATNGGAIKTTALSWSEAAKPTEILFTLTTSTDSKANIHAMASMAVVLKPK